MKGRAVALFLSVALVVGLLAGFVFAAIRAPAPTRVPAIILESDSSPPESENEPTSGDTQGEPKAKDDNQGESPGGGVGPTSTTRSPSAGNDPDDIGGGSGGAQLAPPPPPAPAGDDADDIGEESGGAQIATPPPPAPAGDDADDIGEDDGEDDGGNDG
jgi:hypothetical protein